MSVLRANNSDGRSGGGSGVGRRPTEVKDSLIERERENTHFPPWEGFSLGWDWIEDKLGGTDVTLAQKSEEGGTDRPTE